MENVEISQDQAAEVVKEATESSLDSEVAQQVEDSVILADENGITGEDIEGAVVQAGELFGQEVASAYSLSEGQSTRANKKYVVVLDPGHGGSDGGAENKYGNESESKLTLKIAKYLKSELSKYSQLMVYMTRENDTYLRTSDRVSYAVNKNADILVSLHLNSFTTSEPHGAEVLVPKTGRYNTEVASNAQELASGILERLVSLGLYNRGLKERDSENNSKYPDGSTADYFDIISGGMRAGIPAIIVEHAFISGAADAQYLDSEADLKKLAKADADGILEYFGISQGEWKKIDGKWYYYVGDEIQKGWIKVNDKWYYLSLDGVMQTGWQKIDGKWYYLNSSGAMQVGWQEISGKWYYLNSSGAMLTGWQKIDNKWYLFGGTGVKQTGWVEAKGNKYYLNINGEMQIGWLKIDSKWYYLNVDGVMQTGWIELKGKKYYLDSNGVMLIGWQELNGKRYYFNGSGVLQTGWLKIDNKWYLLSRSGVMQSGWQKIVNKWYYFGGANDGAMKCGWQNINSLWYYFGGNEDGVMQTGWKQINKKWYLLSGNGVMQTGWHKVANKWYYFGGVNDGAMKCGWQKVGNKWFYLNNDGVMQTGWQQIKNKWYLLNGSGVMQTGWHKVANKWYYFGDSGDGVMKTGWLNIGTKWYYMNSSGVMQTGLIRINGKLYYFDSSGVWDKNAVEGLYNIVGSSSVSVAQMVKYYQKSGAKYPSKELEAGGASNITAFCQILLEEADTEKVRAEVVFVQAMKETGWLQFGGDVSIKQFNFAGIGAIGNGVEGASFDDVRTGLRAQVQHLKAYASNESLIGACVDPRFQYVTRNTAPYVEWLGCKENPNGDNFGWATSANYGYDLVEMIEKLKKF